MELPETVRAKINRIVDEARGDAEIGPVMQHMITQICYEMYMAGLNDGFTMAEIAVKTAKEGIRK